MPAKEPLDFSQPENKLSSIAEQERKKLLPKNDYKQENDEYNTKHPDALATGDLQGKGTGGFLDVYNKKAGSISDINDRIGDIKINNYKEEKPYTTPSA